MHSLACGYARLGDATGYQPTTSYAGMMEVTAVDFRGTVCILYTFGIHCLTNLLF